ncbi:hypothetical protein [Chryseobacterium sp. 2VB]|uniref:hypothetical protein n=1 Tax=Chryseobacterium sp. 2VB TaxID=2502204 RepID=UPI0010F8DB74|nr:hypothetical protein [Chryseobacterium sp. 2VB]
MSHQEKQRIFDEYAKSQGYEDWNSLQVLTIIKFQDSEKLKNQIFAACDLVQEEQQKRISASLKNVEVAESTMREYADEIGMMDEEEYMEVRKKIIKKNKEFIKSVKSIINPENLIK